MILISFFVLNALSRPRLESQRLMGLIYNDGLQFFVVCLPCSSFRMTPQLTGSLLSAALGSRQSFVSLYLDEYTNLFGRFVLRYAHHQRRFRRHWKYHAILYVDDVSYLSPFIFQLMWPSHLSFAGSMVTSVSTRVFLNLFLEKDMNSSRVETESIIETHQSDFSSENLFIVPAPHVASLEPISRWY